ncbi:hypothetical protein [Tenacibaculum caenipelagi]|uniref:Uncharacterized protein n=1 Tax=Tenacibaculum caenipelagi TaxID=1325435 RepID=A0A4V3D2S1_9FLAO|nr:hypothetical protein [Tenacibaculum caenipelagi]TDQ22725.1 hypothetical protein DFQ07_2742 [Tenacibaculum caenipelagi]
MSVKYHKEKHLQATKYKIENVIRQQDFLLKHRWKVIAAGIVFSFWAPAYTPGHYSLKRTSILEKTDYTYLKLVMLCASVYMVFCLLYHFSSRYQDKKKLNELKKLEKRLEKEISELD